MDTCRDKNKHEWDARCLGLEVKPSSSKRGKFSSCPSEKISRNTGWNYALVITNINYDEAEGFGNLVSARGDFEDIVETLANDSHINFDMTVMEKKKTKGPYNAGEGSDFERRVTENGFINTEDIEDALETYIQDLTTEMKENNKSKIDSFLFHYIGHGVISHSQDCLIGTTGKATTIKSIQKLIEGLNADKNFLLIDACRENTGNRHQLNERHDSNYELPLDKNFTMVYGAPRGWKAPDVPDVTLTCCIAEHLRSKKSVKVNEIQKTLETIWDEKQERVKYHVDVEIKGSQDIEFP